MPSDDLNFSFDEPAPPRKRAEKSVRPHEEERLPEEPIGMPAPPSRPDFNGRASAQVGRTLPHSLESEEYLISTCLLDAAEIMPRCEAARISPESFYDSKHGIVYGAIWNAWKRGLTIDTALVAQELKGARQLETVGGYPFLIQVSGRIPTTAQASYFIGKVREQAILRELIRSATAAVEDCYGFSGDIAGFAQEIEGRIATVTKRAQGEISSAVKSICDFDYPVADDPNVLLGTDDYLGRGGGMLFVSHAGAGKSSFILDAVMSWALGLPWMGIRCNGPLKSLIVQAEDSDRYLGKLRRSFSHVHGLSPDDEAKLRGNCVIARVKGKSGAPFFAELRRLVAKYKPDLVVVNPIYLYAEGDIGRSEYAQPFLVALDDLNREERFAYILVHHTGKPQSKDSKGKRAELEDWETIYMGFGSSYLANWPRCSALLEPRQGEKSRYWLKLGKGGMNAGVTREVEHQASKRVEPVTKIAIKHSAARMEIEGRERPVIYWEPDDEAGPADPELSGDEPRRKGGRPKAAVKVTDFREKFAAKLRGRENRKGFNFVHKLACEAKAVSKGKFNELIDECVAEGLLVKDSDGDYYMPG